MKRIFTLLLILLPLCVMAQNKVTIKGVVRAEIDNEPLIGVSVVESGTYNGTTTDLDGNYVLEVVEGATIDFSMIGFTTQKVKATHSMVKNILLADDVKALDEVVVIGYGVVKKSDLTSSITTVKGDELKQMTSGNALASLQGKANGVQVVGAGGPGAAPRVIIRGVTSINGSDPLYVVDGVPVGNNINFLNQNDIESMEVLKDASASAIYGTRGSNGVVLISTKKGKAGKTTFNFNAAFGFETIKNPKMANADTYEKAYKERYTNDQDVPVWNNKQALSSTNWWKQTVNDVAYTQTYNVSFQGGTEKFLYSGSLGYFKQDSQFDVGYWDRLTARFNTEYKFNDIVKAGVDFAPRYESIEEIPEGLFENIMTMDPTTPVYRAKSQWGSNPFNNYARSYHNQEWNPAGKIARADDHSKEYGLIMNPFIEIKPIEGLVLRSQFGLNVRNNMHDTFTPKFYIDNLEKVEESKAERQSFNWVDWSWTNTASYMKTFNQKHNINLMAGYTMEKFAEYSLVGSREGIPSNHKDLRYVSAGTRNYQATGTDIYNTLISYLGRVMYNYDNRYYITGSVRVDGSSKFPSGKQYATFPSVSLAWRVSEEAFMKNQKVFSNLKLRAGWGQVGNQNIDPSAYLNLLESADYVFGSDGERAVGNAIGLVGNHNLKWETVEDINFGIDASFLDDRLSVIADVFSKKSTNMLMQKNNLLVLGYPMWDGEMWSNIGSMKAQGWELSINWRDRVSDFSYDIGVNLSSVKNKAEKFASDAPLWKGSFYNDYVVRNIAGGEISRFYGYQADGIFQNDFEINSHTNNQGAKMQPNAKPGDIRFKDLNNDGVIDDSDKKYIGNAFPDLMMGVNIKMAYKNFDFAANFYGTFGNDIYNSSKTLYAGMEGRNMYQSAYNKAWRGEGSTNSFPRLSANDPNMNYKTVSSFFVEDGSYFRCKLLQVGYTLPKKFTKDLDIRFSASAQNLFTITSYSGMDPERASMGVSVMESGIDNMVYPNPRTFLLGVNVNF